ncbi:MAG: ABC transporter permease, partial [Nitrospirae bacterium]
KGKLRMVLFIPSGFSKDFYKKGRAELQVLIDGGYPYTASTIRGYAQSIVDALNMELMEKKGLQKSPPIELRTRFFFNESLKSSNALVPGLLVVIMMVNPAVLVATAVAREREFGTIYNIYSSPVRKIEFFAGKLLPYLVISFLNLFILVFFVYLLFGIYPKGNPLVLIPFGLLYVTINILFGFLISSATRTIVAAQIITLIVTTIPAFLYSGLLIPVSHLGPEGQFMARLYPAMYFMQVIQGVYLKKLNFFDLFREGLYLGLYMLLLGVLSYHLFQKRES